MSQAAVSERRPAPEPDSASRPAAPPWRLGLSAPRAALACAMFAFLNAAVWALVLPSFHVPDEPQHVAYVQYLAETGKLPRPVGGDVFSKEEGAAFTGVWFNDVAGNRQGHPPWTRDHDRALERQLAGDLDRRSDGALTNTTNNPPLYYLVEAVPYKALAGADFWTRVLAMRLVSALLAGLTTLFVFLFLRELMPRSPLAWLVGSLAAGLAPVLGFVCGGVNNDAGLFVAGAATLWALARTFRRGLDARSGALVGGTVGLGLITKATFVGLAPGLLVAAVVLLARQRDATRRDAWRGLAAAVGAMAAPVLLYVVVNNIVWDRPLWNGGVVADAGATARDHQASLSEFASYLWQFYLPKLPGMSLDIGNYPLWETWFKGWIGRFGWLDYAFPALVFKLAAVAWVALLALAARGLWQVRATVAARRGELATYAALVAGLLLALAVQGYFYRIDTGFVFEQARYLVPLLGLYAALVALAVRGAGPRWAPTAGAAIVLLTLVHGLGALVMTVGRYYA